MRSLDYPIYNAQVINFKKMCFWLFIRINKIKSVHGTSLVVHWVRLCASTAGGTGPIPGWGIKMQHVLSKKKKKIASIRQVPPGGLVTKLCPTLATLWTVACQAPQSMGFSRQEYWSGLPFPSPGDLPHPGVELRSPALQVDSFPAELSGKPQAPPPLPQLPPFSIHLSVSN